MNNLKIFMLKQEYKSIGSLLKYYRKINGNITQNRVAIALGVKQPFYYQLENETRSLALCHIEKLASLYCLSKEEKYLFYDYACLNRRVKIPHDVLDELKKNRDIVNNIRVIRNNRLSQLKGNKK